MTSTLRLELSEPAAEALQSLRSYPSRSTASGMANSPYLVNSLGPAAMHRGLTELAGRGLAVSSLGRWSLTDLGRDAGPQPVRLTPLPAAA